MRRRVLALTGCLPVVLLLAGCSGDDGRPEAVVTRTVTATPTATAAATSPSATTGPAVALRLEKEGARYFETPSRNIGCFLIAYATGPTVECTVRSREFDDPPKPEDCDLAWIPQFTLTREAAYGACRGDVNTPLPTVVLEYGTAAVNRSIRCTSEETGLTCRNEDTGHGFKLRRAEYDLF